MNRLLTSLVQLALLVPALIGVRAMWEWLKEDVRELTRQARRVDLTMSDRPAVFAGVIHSFIHRCGKPLEFERELST